MWITKRTKTDDTFTHLWAKADIKAAVFLCRTCSAVRSAIIASVRLPVCSSSIVSSSLFGLFNLYVNQCHDLLREPPHDPPMNLLTILILITYAYLLIAHNVFVVLPLVAVGAVAQGKRTNKPRIRRQTLRRKAFDVVRPSEVDFQVRIRVRTVRSRERITKNRHKQNSLARVLEERT